MGHRALVAYRRADGRYQCHRSQWGADRLRLLGEITPSTPYGRPPGDPPVEPTPRGTAASFEALASQLDYWVYEAVYRVSTTGAVGAFVPLWLGLETVAENVGSSDPTEGVLVAVETPAEAASLRRWFRSLKGAVGAGIERSDLDPAAAGRLLRGRIRQRYGSRELYWSTGAGASGASGSA